MVVQRPPTVRAWVPCNHRVVGVPFQLAFTHLSWKFIAAVSGCYYSQGSTGRRLSPARHHRRFSRSTLWHYRRYLVPGPQVSSGLPHHTFTTVCPIVCLRSGAIMADDRPPLSLDAHGHDRGVVWCLWLLVIICIKTAKYVMHFVRRLISHIELRHSPSVEQPRHRSPKYCDNHAGSNYT